MSHACATLLARPARLTTTVTAPARPLLVVERLDDSADTAVLFTLCGSPNPAPAAWYPAQATTVVAAPGDVAAGAWV